jgi:hypothetical protein
VAALPAGADRHAAGAAVADAARLVDEDIVEVDDIHRLRGLVDLGDVARREQLVDADATTGQLGRGHAQAEQAFAAVAEDRATDDGTAHRGADRHLLFAKATRRFLVLDADQLLDHLEGPHQGTIHIVIGLARRHLLDEQVLRIAVGVGHAEGHVGRAPDLDAGHRRQRRAHRLDARCEQAHREPDAGQHAGIQVRIVDQHRRAAGAAALAHRPVVAAHRDRRARREWRIGLVQPGQQTQLAQWPRARRLADDHRLLRTKRVHVHWRQLAQRLVSAELVDQLLHVELGLEVGGLAPVDEVQYRDHVLQRPGPRRCEARQLQFQRVVVGVAFDVGVHALDVPHQEVARLGRQQLGMALGIAAQAQQADLPVAGQAARAHRFGQPPGGDGTVALDLEQPTLRHDKALRANQVRCVGGEDVRDAVLVAVHAHRCAQARQRQLAVDLGAAEVADESRCRQRGGGQHKRHRGPQAALGKKAAQESLLFCLGSPGSAIVPPPARGAGVRPCLLPCHDSVHPFFRRV